MAENLQTTRPAEEGWTTVIRPKTGWFDIDLNELWRYRDLITMFVKRNFTVLYKQTILGPAWIILNPLITTIIFNVVFGGMANMPTDGVPGFLFYMAGNTVWTFFANCVNNTANTFVTNSQIFGKVYFPRLTMPVSQVLTSLINFGIQAVMYARLRKVDNDFGRTARQRKLMELLLEKVLDGGMSMTELNNLLNACMPYVQTNMKASTLFDLALGVLRSGISDRLTRGESLLEQHHVPMDGTYSYLDVDGASVINMGSKSFPKNVRALHEFIYGEYIPAD